MRKLETHISGSICNLPILFMLKTVRKTGLFFKFESERYRSFIPAAKLNTTEFSMCPTKFEPIIDADPIFLPTMTTGFIVSSSFD
jgi:hypothetical protein